MNHILIFVPTTVLLSSIVVYFFLKKESDFYIEKIREKKNRKARLISLQLIKGIILFFGTSRTSRETDRILQALAGSGTLEDHDIDQISMSAIPEISFLYSQIEDMRRMDHESGVLETLLRILVIFILIYGVVVSVIQYTVLFGYYLFPGSINVGEISQIIIGATIIFALLALFICLDVFRRASLMVRVSIDNSEAALAKIVKTHEQE